MFDLRRPVKNPKATGACHLAGKTFSRSCAWAGVMAMPRNGLLGSRGITNFGKVKSLSGRVGTGAYDSLHRRYGAGVVVGIESNLDKVAQHQGAGRNVIHGDATDTDFWDQLEESPHRLKAVLLAMPEYRSNMYAVQQMKAGDFKGFIGALAKFAVQGRLLKNAGVDAVFNMYAEAGTGFAASVDDTMAAILKPPTEA